MTVRMIFGIAIVILIGLGAEADAGSGQRKGHSALPPQYISLVELGEARLVAGDLEGAEAAFEAAARENLFEVPNYRVLSRVAEVKCLRGHLADGSALLREFDCMLNVEVGTLRCFREQTAALQGRNPKLSPLCFERMCGEIYLAYYENPSRDTLQEVAELRKGLARVSTACKASMTK